ncbi:hypothetical protein LO763_21790 [Glycomyces sp. A-F 0318]|uniref:hypothetical protein n=1 Tax=Glycomyces amatae TaxID=2881355 RepID=UPI001E59822D|nr:hypothetical protein [Glycomyces amatae]MCD0446248.1 hypothetical protein [Glycomyces amatae]
MEDPKTDQNTAQPSLGAPWHPLMDAGRGYLAVYFCDPLARWPVREITRPRDNKSDPNIETGTFGLFSTCEPGMRNRIVQDNASTIFFLTTRKGGQGRVLTGYYHIGWWTHGTQGVVNRDFALAADAIRLIDPIAAVELPEPLATPCTSPFRTVKPIGEDIVRALRELCDRHPDRTNEYVDEVRRIERFARARSGFSYPSWGRRQGFSWDDAADFYQHGDEVRKVPNSSRTKKWHCSNCDYVITSGALLKQCPLCNKTASLTPLEAQK